LANNASSKSIKKEGVIVVFKHYLVFGMELYQGL